MRHQRGFTLLELMVTISVAAVLIAVGIPGMQDFVRNNRRAAEVNNLVAALQFARSEAVSRNRLVIMCPSTDGASCAANTEWEAGWIVHVDLNDDGAITDNEVLRAEAGPDVMTVRSDFQSLAYRPNGRLWTNPGAGSSGDLTFCDSRGASESRVVQLDISGRPSTSTKRLDGSSPTCP